MTRLVRLLYPKAQRHELRRQARALNLALALGLFMSVIVAAIIYLVYNSDRFWH